jgi:hypothetical protein
MMAELSSHCPWYSGKGLKQKGTGHEQVKEKMIWGEVVEDQAIYRCLGLFHLRWCALTLHSNAAFHEAGRMAKKKYILGKVSYPHGCPQDGVGE